MLKGVDPVLTPEMLYALSSMGHGDEVVVADAHFPAEKIARRTTHGKLLRAEGGGSPRVVRAILSVLELDAYIEHPAERMMVDGEPDTLPQVQREAADELSRATGRTFTPVARGEFYERAKDAFCVVVTAETRGWGCFILTKGVLVTPDEPASAGGSTVGEWTP
ncbi:RbsD/FucU family protein [Sphaerisporangium aureirubrum]|uniref:RbsD/FucU family protein n=1 Tax=Sphaerisporangium aureirubrum TaxID=1544736 RepID=A0ABW1N8S0_9ACTN